MNDHAKLAEEDIIETDVLVVGAEGAGARAAIEAHRQGASVILLTKGSDIGRAGATITAYVSNIAIDSRSVTELLGMPGDTEDSWEQFFEDIVIEGRYVNDQKQAEVLAQEAGPRAKELTDWGYRWSKVIGPTPGHRYRRACYGHRFTGPAMLKVMGRVINTQTDVKVMGDMLALDLLTRDGRVVGLVALNLRTGQLQVFKAKAVIFATGGAQNVYPFVSGPHDLTGDGHAIAYRAGAELIDMEFVQLIPAALLWPPGWDHGRHGPIPYILMGHPIGDPHLLNRRGERFLSKWDPVRMENSTRDILGIAVATEIAEGRGSQHGGVYLSLKHLPDNLLDYYGEWGPCKDWKSASGFDYKPLIDQMKKGLALEVGIYCHFHMGGISVNEWGAGSVPGLYAAGECAGLVHGANRLSGVALSQIIVQGARAGMAAADYSRMADLEPVDAAQVEQIKNRVFSPLLKKNGIGPLALRREIQELAYSKVGVIRDAKGLDSALAAIREFGSSVSDMATQTKCPQYNLEWIDAIQTQNLLQVLELIAASALVRTESRGAHYRKDHPVTDNDQWLKNVIIKKVDDAPSLRTRPVIVTRLQPPSGVRPYPAL